MSRRFVTDACSFVKVNYDLPRICVFTLIGVDSFDARAALHKVLDADERYALLATDDDEFSPPIPGAPLLGVVGSHRLFISPPVGRYT
jgi:hypothetical protein